MASKTIAQCSTPQTSRRPTSKPNAHRSQLQAKTQNGSDNLTNLISNANKDNSSAAAFNPAVNPNNQGPQISSLTQVIRAKTIQPKLSIGAANSSYEQEADSVADKVVALNSFSAGTGSASKGAETNGSGHQIKAGVQTHLQSKTNNAPAINSKSNSQTIPGVQRSFMDLAGSEQESEQEAESGALAASFSGEGEVLTKLIQASQALSTSDTPASPAFESSLQSSKGSGSPLPDNTRAEMETGIGANFGAVKIHTNDNAAQMNQQINAKAFTHGSDIYFNQGQYNPESSSGKHLLAHELTHTVQQGASPQTQASPDSGNISRVGNQSTSPSSQAKIQRGWLGSAIGAISDAASSAVNWAADQINSALNWAKEKFAGFVQSIPGYKLLSVILGQDPVTGKTVARNGRNFIEAGLNIIPFGSKFQQKLEATGAMEEAATWLDQKIAKLDISLTSILNDISNFWSSRSLSDLTNVSGVLSQAANIIRRPIASVISFATSIASKLLEIVKKYLLNSLVGFIKDHTRGYPLLTVILGKDPITDEAVERSGMNLIRGFMLLSASGEEQLRQMEETGSLQKAADWIDGAVARLDLSWQSIKNMFSKAWDLVSISSLMDPIGAFTQLAQIFLAPAGRIIRFVVEVGIKILGLIKDALIARLIKFARKIPGYPLLTVILGKDPFSGNPVPRTAENIIHGFLSLLPGGEEKFQTMKESGAIDRATSWIEGAIAELGFTWKYIKGLFMQAWNSFSLSDLAAPLEAFGRIMNLFIDPLKRLFSFIIKVLKKIIEIILSIMGFPTDLVVNIVTRAMQAFADIKRDPIGFILNLLKAIKKGFSLFFDNILKHLFNGLTSWLFQQVKDAGITPPKDLSLGSIFGFVLDVLGITAEKIWQKLADKIGQEKVNRIRGMIDKLTGVWTFVKDVMTRGPIAIWEYIVEKISGLWNMVLEGVQNWIMTKIITQVTAKLLSMLDPTGIMAVINSTIALYKAIQSFIAYIKQMLQIVNSFVMGVAEIAKGNILSAAKFLEGALAKAVPIAIGFLANQVGLGGLGKRIGEMIKKVQGKVDEALTWLVDKAVSAGSALLKMGKSAISAVKNWWQTRKEFTDPAGKKHALYYPSAQGELTVASTPTPVNQFLDKLVITDTDPKKAEKQGHKTKALAIMKIINDQRAIIQKKGGKDAAAEAKVAEQLALLPPQLTPLMVGDSGGRIPSPLTLEALKEKPVKMPRTPEEETIDVNAATQIVTLAAEAATDSLAMSKQFKAIQTRFALTKVSFHTEGKITNVRIQASKNKDVQVNLAVKDKTPGISLKSNVVNVPGAAAGDTVSTGMTADPVGPDKIGKGSEPLGSALKVVMGKLITAPEQKNPSKYIKGHLLNHHIGGPGTGQNMYPITAEANKKHNTSIEETVKGWVEKQSYWVYYQVNVAGISENIVHPTQKHPDNYINSKFVCKAYIRNTDGQEHNPVTSTVDSIYVKGDASASANEPAYQLDGGIKTAMDTLTTDERKSSNLSSKINISGIGPEAIKILLKAYGDYAKGDLVNDLTSGQKSTLTTVNGKAGDIKAAIAAIVAGRAPPPAAPAAPAAAPAAPATPATTDTTAPETTTAE
ncbi:eCIS core domain-containing protein [Thalassomonas actiniarum]|uniref:DUF4157 domain-containing protein n=1 Tax=Thalassomonas actiniarum TaxID=485447 RepID=A0AAE9YHT8_9GAMM|nr:DUF4157 domain-containing protein [Thalassomonas actiniarum]WDD96739.1 DUF4157 domain-containing protein [Thalassomonas actiniarum]